MKTILVPIDFSDVTPRVIETARQFAAAFQSRLVLLNVSEPEPDFVGFEAGPPTVRMPLPRDFHIERQRLEELKAQCAADGGEVAARHLQGVIAPEILREAAAESADLIIIGSHGHGALYDLLVGSITQGVIKDARCPVLVVPAVNKD